jgi:hypothetical protein
MNAIQHLPLLRASALVLSLAAPLVAGTALAQDATLSPDSTAAAVDVPAEASSAEATAAEAHRPSHLEQFRAQARQPGSTRLLTSVISSIGFGPELTWGGGLQLRLDHYPTGLPFRVGGWLQSEVQTDGAVRVAGGLHSGAWFMGCQVGLAYRFESDRYWSTLGVQLGKSIDFGIFQLGGRVVIPVAEFSFRDAQSPSTLTSTGIEGAVYMTVGLPTLLDGEPRDCGCPHRRGHDDDAPE